MENEIYLGFYVKIKIWKKIFGAIIWKLTSKKAIFDMRLKI